MRYLGIDFGTKKVGLAISTPEESMSFPLTVLPNDKNIFKKIKEVVVTREVVGVVIGLPLSETKTHNTFLENVDIFSKELAKHINCPIFFENENYSSRHAALVANKKEDLDSASAVIILDRFLAKKEKGEN